jgi:VanZ family protein
LKIKRAFYLWAAASLLCMIIIFWFSSQTAEESSELSGAVTAEVFSVTQNRLDISESFMETLEILVRKTAHLVIFAVLGFCIANAVRHVTSNARYIFLISLITGSLYAATDEWHQYFIPGRACMWQDWLIDTAW